MVNFTVDQVRATMDRQNHIRNATVIAHVDHGKSTLTDSLVRLAGISTTDRFTQGRDDEQERGITIKSTGLTLYFDLPEEDLPVGADGTGFLFNIIDSPGHVDFSSEVTAALRLTDGALVVVDCVEGVCVQTETVLRQALTERIKPVLIINKLDRMILELQQDPEEAYQTLLRVIESVNAIISTYSDQYSEDWMVSPENGTVAFGSGLHGWGFTVPRFARYLGKQLSKDPKAMQKRLWGDSFWDPEANKWSASPVSDSGKKLRRGFCQFILDPVFKLVKSTNNGNKEVHDRLISRLGIELRGAEKEAQGRDLMKIVMPKWLPFGPVLLHMMTNHLPSPAVAQKYRTELLYTGPSDDVTSEAMRNCDRDGPVLIFISKMVPANKGRFYAYGRVFSGMVKGGQTVRIMGPDYVPGETRDLYEKSIQRTCLAMGRYIENIDDVPCGNIVCLAGIDQYLVKSGTLSTREDSHPLRPMKFSVSPVVRRAIKPKNVADMKKLMSGLKKLSKSDPCVQCIIDESSGQVIVCGAGELHLEIVLKDLVELAGVEIVVEEPIVNYKETVTEVATDPCLAKSPNKHNRLWVTAEPMTMELCTAIAEKKVDPQGDPKVRGKIMTDEFGWDPTDTTKIWNFGPNGSGPNVLVDKTWGVQYMNEIKDHCRAAFENVCEKGILCGEELQGVRWNIKDATLHADSVHRGGAQMVPCTRRVLHAAQLAAKPTLLEPIYLAEITCPESSSGGIYNVLARRRGHVVGVEYLRGGLILLRANLPVAESFGFSSALREATGGMAFPQCVFDHYQVVPGDPFESGSIAHAVVMKIRQRKGMPAELPKLADLVDKL